MILDPVDSGGCGLLEQRVTDVSGDPCVIGGCLGVPVGTWLLPRLPVSTITLHLGVLLVLFAA